MECHSQSLPYFHHFNQIYHSKVCFSTRIKCNLSKTTSHKCNLIRALMPQYLLYLIIPNFYLNHILTLKTKIRIPEEKVVYLYGLFRINYIRYIYTIIISCFFRVKLLLYYWNQILQYFFINDCSSICPGIKKPNKKEKFKCVEGRQEE